MGQAKPLLTIATHLYAMKQKREFQEKLENQRQQRHQQKIERQLATNRARKYASGYAGKSYDGELNRIKNNKLETKPQMGKNPFNAINLLGKNQKQKGIK